MNFYNFYISNINELIEFDTVMYGIMSLGLKPKTYKELVEKINKYAFETGYSRKEIATSVYNILVSGKYDKNAFEKLILKNTVRNLLFEVKENFKRLIDEFIIWCINLKVKWNKTKIKDTNIKNMEEVNEMKK